MDISVDSITDEIEKLTQTVSRLFGKEKEVAAKLESINQSKVNVDTSLAITYEELQFELITIRTAISDIRDAIDSLSMWAFA